MIASIKAEWRKNRLRPAFLVAAGLLAGGVVLSYLVTFYQATHTSGPAAAASLQTLYPAQFVNNVIGVGFPVGAAVALVLGALVAGSEYSWGTLKTVLTQGPGRLSTLAGRVVAFQAWMGILTLIIFALGAVCSVVVATVEGSSIVWPAAADLAKGMGAIWLILAVNGSFGMALGALFKQSAAALGVGLIYVTLLQIVAVRLISSFNGGTYKWIANGFDGQNATALLQSFRSPVSGHSASLAIGAEQAVLVLGAYLAFFLIVSAGLLRTRDVT